MSKKLLSEAEFRKFAKLANLGALADKKIEEIYTDEDEPVEEELSLEDEDEASLEEEEEMPPMPDDEAPLDDEPEMDLDGPMDAGGEVTLSTDDAMSVAAALPAMEKIAAAVDAEQPDSEMPEDEEETLDLGAELEGGEDDVPGGREMGGYMQEEEEMDERRGRGRKGPGKDDPRLREDEEQDEDLVETVARRVAQRLEKQKNLDDIVSQIAERILSKMEK